MNQPKASIAIQVLPNVEGDEVIRVVDRVIEYVAATGLTYHVGAFETTIEGEFNELMDIIKECQLICIREGAPSVMSYVKIAFNPNAGVWSIEKKVAKHQH